jgi:hypothetical protein
MDHREIIEKGLSGSEIKFKTKLTNEFIKDSVNNYNSAEIINPNVIISKKGTFENVIGGTGINLTGNSGNTNVNINSMATANLNSPENRPRKTKIKLKIDLELSNTLCSEYVNEKK